MFTRKHTSSQRESLFTVEDNELVLKMTIKGRSLSKRHVSRTHRVDLDWLLDRINLCPGVQTKCVDTNQEIADILTQGSFSRERRSQLTQLFNLVTPHVRTTSHFRTTKTTRCQIGMLKLSQKVPACAQLVCVRYKWEKDNKTDYVVGVEHSSQTKTAGSNHQRQQSEPPSSAASMEESTLEHFAGWQLHATAKQATSATHKRWVHYVRSHADLPAHKMKQKKLWKKFYRK